MSKTTGQYLFVPDCIVRNENNININPKEFATYCFLKLQHYYSKDKNVVEFAHRKMMYNLSIDDTRTFKKILNNLYKNKLILNGIDKFPKHDTLKIHINNEYINMKPFTKMHINLLYALPYIDCYGLRLIYYYESRINRPNGQEFSFASIRTIAKETKMDKNMVIIYNEKLVKLRLLKIVKHELEHTGMYDSLDMAHITKFNNHYYPRLDRIENIDLKKLQGKINKN